jgi:hypothetical protein
MLYEALETPDLSVTDSAGMCLRFTQSVWGSPVKYPNAWQAWEATQFKHGVAESLPNVPAIIWFSHFASYQGKYDNWGHVVTYVPSKGFLSSPATGNGQLWLSSISEVEKTFNAKYVGWSEDINGLRVLSPSNVPQPKREEKMLSFIATDPNGAWYVTDGLTKRILAPGENQLLVDLGVARYSGKPGNVNLISPQQFDMIPTLEV